MRHLDKAHEHALEVEEVERAIVIMQFYIRQQMRLLRERREAVLENDREELSALLRREGGEITTGKLKKNGRNVEDILSTARAWPKLFRIEETPPGDKGGRPSTKIVLVGFTPPAPVKTVVKTSDLKRQMEQRMKAQMEEQTADNN